MKNFNVKPLNDRVILKQLEEKKTSNGIIIPENVSGEKPQRGIVVATGPGRAQNNQIIKLMVKVGDEVLFGKYSGSEITVDNNKYLVMREDDIIGIIKS